MKIFVRSIGALLLLSVGTAPAWSHCEIPCGIYGDEQRFERISEDILTLEKSIKQIRELSDKPKVHINQLVRWVQNKETHADDIRQIASQYFLAQRIKLPVEAGAQKLYHRRLALLHSLIVDAMRAKQTTDLNVVVRLRKTMEQFREAYFGPQEETDLQAEREKSR